MKRILHLIAQYPDKTGSGTYMKSLLKQGKKNGLNQAVVYAINDGDKVDLSEYGLIKEYVVRFSTEELPFSVVGMSDNMPYESTRYSDMSKEMIEIWKSAFLNRLVLAIDEFKPDLIYSHHLWLLTAVAVNEIGGVPIRAFGHGTDIRQLKNCSLETDYIVRGCRKLDKIFALSSYQKDEISKHYGISREKIEVVGGGFDEEIFKEKDTIKGNLKDSKKKLIYAGKICETKGLKSLLRVYGKLEGNIELTMVGNGETCQRDEIESLAKSVGGDIIFTGQISQKELSEKFKEGDVFVLPSLYEGLALVNIEALASGLRVVTTDIKGLRDYMGKVINGSGLIEYVKLPRESIEGKISKEELQGYEKRLKSSLESQLKKRNREADLELYKKIYKAIEAKSWSKIFKKL